MDQNRCYFFKDTDFELWKISGQTSMVIFGKNRFFCKWTDANNALFRCGKRLYCQKEALDYGTISVDYSVRYHPKGTSYLAVYGWFKDPLVEYYVIENENNDVFSKGTMKGIRIIDGREYSIYLNEVTKPSIEGTVYFKQYISVRRDKAVSGKVTLSEHFKVWNDMDMNLGSLYEVSLNIGGVSGNGKACIVRNKVYIENR